MDPSAAAERRCGRGFGAAAALRTTSSGFAISPVKKKQGAAQPGPRLHSATGGTRYADVGHGVE
jgi:hypothetical protein